MRIKSLKFLLLGILSLLLIDLSIQSFKYLFIFIPNIQEPPSTTTIGYSMHHQGVIKNNFPINSNIKLVESHLNLPNDTISGMPLFLNARDLPEAIKKKQPNITGHYLITGTGGKDQGGILVYDLKKNKIIWKLHTDTPESNSLILSLKWGRIFFRSYDKIYSINIDGSDVQKIHFMPAEYLGKKYRLNWRKSSLRCQSSADGINHDARIPYTFLSCSTSNHYGKKRGIVGHLVALSLDQNGKYITPLKIKVFRTSVPTKDPRTGYNAGIWNSGVGPTLTKNNKLLIATGNGPFFPNQGNYGCSAIKIDGDSFHVDDYYAQQDSKYQECFSRNFEIGSSGISYLKHHSKEIAAVLGKDGYLRVFDPSNMPKSNKLLMKETRIGMQIFGAPILFEENNNIYVIAHGSTSDKHSRKYYFLATDKMISQIKKEKIIDSPIQDEACVGWIKEKGKQDDKFQLYFSGRYRNDFVLVKHNHQISSMLKHYRNIHLPNSSIEAPYNPITTGTKGGYAIKKIPSSLQKKYTLKKLHLSALYNYELINFVSHFGDYLFGSSRYTIPPTQLTADNGTVMVAKKTSKNNFCGNHNPKGFIKLKLFSNMQPPIAHKSKWFVARYKIDSKMNIIPAWRKEFDDNNHHQHTSISAVKTPNDGLIAITLRQGGYLSRSILKIMTVKDGKEIATIPYNGLTHFSMPLWVGNQLFVATKSHGIKSFKIVFWSFRWYFLKKSFIFSWFRYEK